MFDVQSVYCSGQAEFHTSAASGLKSGQFDQKRDFGLAGSHTRDPGFGFHKQFGSMKIGHRFAQIFTDFSTQENITAFRTIDLVNTLAEGLVFSP